MRYIYEDTIIAARVLIYGTRDAGRGFWLRLSEDMCREGFTLNRILPTLFAFRDSDENIVGMMTNHVDDLLFGVTGQVEKGNDESAGRIQCPRSPRKKIQILRKGSRTKRRL